jgi:hypothetical protein
VHARRTDHRGRLIQAEFVSDLDQRFHHGLQTLAVGCQCVIHGGHADATTTLRWYARWLPRTVKRVVDALDDTQTGAISTRGAAQLGSVGSQLVAKTGSEAKSVTPALPKWPISLVGRQGLEPWTR